MKNSIVSIEENIRFPDDFMFQLSQNEWKELITKCDKLGSYKFAPYSRSVI